MTRRRWTALTAICLHTVPASSIGALTASANSLHPPQPVMERPSRTVGLQLRCGAPPLLCCVSTSHHGHVLLLQEVCPSAPTVCTTESGGSGVPNTDFILMATAKATAGLCDPGGSTVAYATWCQMDQFNRYACRVACYCHSMRVSDLTCSGGTGPLLLTPTGAPILSRPNPRRRRARSRSRRMRLRTRWCVESQPTACAWRGAYRMCRGCVATGVHVPVVSVLPRRAGQPTHAS